MTDKDPSDPKQSLSGTATALYFVLSFLASGPIAAEVSAMHAKWRQVSNFEGKAGMAAVMATPLWFALLVGAFWLLYPVMRHSPGAVWFANLAFGALTVPLIAFVVDLL